jgi:medium-chain acyl-[acyl-carrier-protein] hydrolase
MFRQDYAIRSQFSAQAGLMVEAPLLVLAAEDDPHVPPERMRAWAAHTTAETTEVVIPGGHFAAMEEPDRVLPLLAETLARDLATSGAGGDRHPSTVDDRRSSGAK